MIHSLTCVKTQRGVLWVRRSVRYSRGGGVAGPTGIQVSLDAGQERHVGQLPVMVLGVEGHGAHRGGAVPERRGQAGGAAVHHAGVYEGGDGVQLLPEAVRRNSCPTAGSGAEERHAALDTVPRVRRWDLGGKVSDFTKVLLTTTNLTC